MLAIAGIASLILSFIFALGGVGSAATLVHTLHSLSFDLAAARPIGLFVNTTSLAGASYLNIRSGIVRFTDWKVLILFSILCAPIGTKLSFIIPETALLYGFALFFFTSGIIMIWGGKKVVTFRALTAFEQALIGCFSGLIAGLLGVGSGGLLIPILCYCGFQPKQIAAITALIVPISSIAGFASYAVLGSVDYTLLLVCGGAAMFGGYFGTQFMHSRLSQATVKRFLALVMFFLGAKTLLSVLDLF
ncbi:MAG: sulfite exporter TauE/SafE family protein [Desulfovibrio sp.]